MHPAGRKKYLIAGAVISLGLIAAGVGVASRAAKPPVVATKAALAAARHLADHA